MELKIARISPFQLALDSQIVSFVGATKHNPPKIYEPYELRKEGDYVHVSMREIGTGYLRHRKYRGDTRIAVISRSAVKNEAA